MTRIEASPAELRFHMYRLGSRRRVGRLYGVRKDTICELLPVSDIDRFMTGQMVNIGGILAKRCARCGTARELEAYWTDDDRASGCGARCKLCRRLKR